METETKKDTWEIAKRIEVCFVKRENMGEYNIQLKRIHGCNPTKKRSSLNFSYLTKLYISQKTIKEQTFLDFLMDINSNDERLEEQPIKETTEERQIKKLEMKGYRVVKNE